MNKARQYHSDLSSLLHGISHVPSALNTQIHGIQSDSRHVKPGDLFIALDGISTPANHYVHDAISRGASAVLVECSGQTPIVDLGAHEDGDAVELFVPNLRDFVGEIAHRFFHQPSSELQVVGVTGTNGKTSVVNYLAQFFAAQGLSTAVIGTLGYGLCAEGESLIDTQHTTPDVVDVHRFLAHLRDCGAELVAMEVSSHGLSQGRVNGVRFEGAVFTNLSRDHMDYHGTMEEYGNAKARLFELASLEYAVLNNDDPVSEMMAERVRSGAKIVRYALDSDADVLASAVDLSDGIKSVARLGEQTVNINSSLMGNFNLLNLLAVLGVAAARKCNQKELEKINVVKAVPGRVESFKVSGKPTLIVDYAHTPDALDNVLSTLKAQDRKILLVFGCGGDRDTGKRAQMAEIAEKYADFTFVTDDNPRTENPANITDDIEKGFTRKAIYTVIHDRAAAIQKAFESADAADLVLIAGKGHENYQEIQGQRAYFSDADQCRGLLGLQKIGAAIEGADA